MQRPCRKSVREAGARRPRDSRRDPRFAQGRLPALHCLVSGLRLVPTCFRRLSLQLVLGEDFTSGFVLQSREVAVFFFWRDVVDVALCWSTG